MTTAPRILLIASPLMKPTPALHRAIALATAMRASLHIVAFDFLEDLATATLVDADALEQIRIGYVERHKQWLTEQAEQLRLHGQEVTTEIFWGQNALDETLIHARELPAALIIKDVRHESSIKRALFSTQDIRLLRDSPCPVHLVTHAPHAMPRRILAAVDVYRPDNLGRDNNDAIIAQACNLAMQCDAEVHLLYAYDLYGLQASEWGYGSPEVLYASNVFEELYNEAVESFKALADKHSIPEANRHFISGNPGGVICSFADKHQIDLVVIARSHRRGLDKWLGGTAEYVLYKCPESTLSL